MRFPYFIALCALHFVGLRGQSPNLDVLQIDSALVDRLLRESLSQSPGLQAAKVKTEGAGAEVRAVRRWADPTVSLGVSASSRRGFKASEEGDLSYGIEQRLPTFGRPDLQRRVAEANAVREQRVFERETAERRRDFFIALNLLARDERELELAEDDLRWLELTRSALEQRYRIGKASEVEWLKIQTADALAADELKSKRREAEHSALSLNRLLNRSLHAPWPRVVLPQLQRSLSYNDRLVEAAAQTEPQLRILQQEGAAADLSAELTRRQRQPEVGVGLQVRQFSGDGRIREGTATFDFSLPWLNRQRYEEDWRRDRLQARAILLSAEDRNLAVQEELHHRLTELDAIQRRGVLYRDQLIPLARQTLASVEAAWESNRGVFQDVVESHRLLVADELALVEAVASQGTLLAEINLLTGTRGPAELFELAGDAPQTGRESENH